MKKPTDVAKFEIMMAHEKHQIDTETMYKFIHAIKKQESCAFKFRNDNSPNMEDVMSFIYGYNQTAGNYYDRTTDLHYYILNDFEKYISEVTSQDKLASNGIAYLADFADGDDCFVDKVLSHYRKKIELYDEMPFDIYAYITRFGKDAVKAFEEEHGVKHLDLDPTEQEQTAESDNNAIEIPYSKAYKAMLQQRKAKRKQEDSETTNTVESDNNSNNTDEPVNE